MGCDIASAVLGKESAESNPAGSLLVAKSEPPTAGAATGRDATVLAHPKTELVEPPAGRLLSDSAVVEAN